MLASATLTMLLTAPKNILLVSSSIQLGGSEVGVVFTCLETYTWGWRSFKDSVSFLTLARLMALPAGDVRDDFARLGWWVLVMMWKT